MNFKSSLLMFSILLVMGCMPKGTLRPTEVYPVQWFPGFDMARKLDKKIFVHDQREIQALLDKPWYMPFQLINLQTREVFSADRCSQILPTITQLETHKPYEYPSFRYLAVMCVATQTIANAHPAQYSFLSDFKLDANFPRHAPKNLAFFTSSSEWRDVSQNKAIISWDQAKAVKFVSMDGKYQAKYYTVTGSSYQELSLIARGDFNHDRIEDLLLYAMNYVVGGSYVAYRLFWITKTDKNSPITLVREYPVYD